MLKHIWLLGLLGLLSACGGGGGGNGGGGDSASSPPVLTGQLIDSAVEGVTFQTPTLNGITNSRGEFQYRDGELIEFRIGNLQLGAAIPAQAIITPVSLTRSTHASSDDAIRLMQLLQSLDEDQNLTNGITIPDAIRRQAEGYPFVVTSEFTDADLENIVANITIDNRKIVNQDEALNHYFESVASLNYVSGLRPAELGLPKITELQTYPIASESHTVRILAMLDSPAGPAYATIQVGGDAESQMQQLEAPTSWAFDIALAEVENQPVTIRLKSLSGEVISSYYSTSAVDSDYDRDGVANSIDAFPFNAKEVADTDNDGIGNHSDPDDDGDGIVDQQDDAPLESSIFDTTAPTLLYSEPLDGGTTYNDGLVIRAVFNESIMTETINPETFSLTDGDRLIPASVVYDEARKTAFLTPENKLVINKSYTAFINEEVSDVQGNLIGNKAEWSFSIEGRWRLADAISPYVVARSFFKFSADKNGNGILTWTTLNESTYTIWAYQFDENSQLVNTTKIVEGNDHVYDNSISHTPTGDAILLWTKRVQERSELWAVTYKPSSGWGVSRLLYQSDTGNTLNNIQAAFNESGQGILSFGVEVDSQESRYLVGMTFDGETWNTPTRLSNEVDDYWGWVDVDIDEAGNALTVWDATINPRWMTSARAIFYSSESGWGEAYTLSTTSAQSPQVAFTSLGKAIVVWGDFGVTGEGIQWASFSAETGWSSSDKLADGYETYAISLASNDEGRLMAAWSDMSPRDFRAVEYVEGEGWGAPYVLDTRLSHVARKIAPLPAGGFVVSWREGSNMSDSNIKTAIYKDGSWESATVLNNPTQNVGRIGLNVLQNGEIWVDWEGASPDTPANIPSLMVRKYR